MWQIQWLCTSMIGHATSVSCFFPSKERIEIISSEDLVGIFKSFVWSRVWKFFFHFTGSFWFWTCSINLCLLLPQNYSLVMFALGSEYIWKGMSTIVCRDWKCHVIPHIGLNDLSLYFWPEWCLKFIKNYCKNGVLIRVLSPISYMANILVFNWLAGSITFT